MKSSRTKQKYLTALAIALVMLLAIPNKDSSDKKILDVNNTLLPESETEDSAESDMIDLDKSIRTQSLPIKTDDKSLLIAKSKNTKTYFQLKRMQSMSQDEIRLMSGMEPAEIKMLAKKAIVKKLSELLKNKND